MSEAGNRHGGSCRCGRVAFKYDPAAVTFVAYCHCRDCRRQTGAPVSAWVGISTTGIRWQGTKPATYTSSPGVRWGHCADCGTPLTYDDARDGGEIHVLIGAFAAPEELPPQRHVRWAERLPWLAIADDLPKHVASGTSPVVDEGAAAE